MPVLIRPNVGLPAAGALPDPSQRVIALRDLLRLGYLLVALCLAIGCGLGLAVVAAVDDVTADGSALLAMFLLSASMTVVDWRALRARMDAAEPLHPPVRRVRPALRPDAADVAKLAGLTAGVVVFFGWLFDHPALPVAFVAALPVRAVVTDRLIARRERRAGVRFLERAELPEDHELLYADPEAVAALEAA